MEKKFLKNWKKIIKFTSVSGGHLIWWNGISLQQKRVGCFEK
jgi:hypothetical protein